MKNNLVFLILDSCRYDTFVAANTPNFDRIGKVEKRWSYASWTAPSHYAYLMGMMPHTSPKGVYASEVYKEEFVQWVERLGIPNLSFRDFLPEISLPKVLGNNGYYCSAKVSMPVLNQFTPINAHFDDYKLMGNHNDFAGMVEEIEFADDQPHFYFLNLGETHYPYMLTDAGLPHISGVHGVFKSLGAQEAEGSAKGEAKTEAFFDMAQMKELHQQQIKCTEYVDDLFGKLLDKAPENTYFIITADHGELFGEEGYFGHGPIMHEKCFEVPFIEGRLR